jgi:hypothetical protein
MLFAVIKEDEPDKIVGVKGQSARCRSGQWRIFRRLGYSCVSELFKGRDIS